MLPFHSTYQDGGAQLDNRAVQQDDEGHAREAPMDANAAREVAELKLSMKRVFTESPSE